MPLIKIPELSYKKLEDSSLERNYLYKDLLLDLRMDVFYNEQLQKGQQLRDVKPLFDLEAVKNSITNIFLTAPGEKILSPEFGLDLRRYLFEPISEFNAFAIKDDIRNRLPIMEPRIEIDRVGVIPNADLNEYQITLQINIPSLNVYGISLRSTLNNNGYFIF